MPIRALRAKLLAGSLLAGASCLTLIAGVLTRERSPASADHPKRTRRQQVADRGPAGDPPSHNVSWAWYAGAWQDALDNPSHIYNSPYQFQAHHHPFNYYANYAPGTTARATHLS
jgi:hypothetical protein